MDDAKRQHPIAPEVDAARQQQHTGNHDRPATERGGQNLEIGAARRTMVYTVTGDDAREIGRDPALYARQLAAALQPYGVTVRFLPDQRGRGSLAGCDDTKLEVDIRQAVARVSTAPNAR